MLAESLAPTDNHMRVQSCTSLRPGAIIAFADPHWFVDASEFVRVADHYVSGEMVPIERSVNHTTPRAHARGDSICWQS